MKEKKVQDILVPFREDTPLRPSVALSDRLVYAVELMAKHNRKCIAVVRKGRPIGMVCLKEAFQKLGLKSPAKE